MYEIKKRDEIQNEQQYRNALEKLSIQKMELPSKILEQIALKIRPKFEKLMLIVLEKSTHEESSSQPFRTNIKQFMLAVTFLSGIFKVTNRNKKNYFHISI